MMSETRHQQCRSEPGIFAVFQRDLEKRRGRPKRQTRRLGDIAANIFETTGVARLARLYEELSGENCGCEQRKEWLNRKSKAWGEWIGSFWSKPRPQSVAAWAVGMTTCPREESTIRETVHSLWRAGWNDLLISEDREKLGAWNNFRWCLALMVERWESADAFLILQDDVALSSNLRNYLESALWIEDKPQVVSLYTPRQNHDSDRNGWHALQSCQKPYGALAYVFTPETARVLLASTRPKRKGECGVDLKVGRFCREHGFNLWMHSPSFVQHTGRTSTISGLGLEKTRRCRLFCEDASKLPDWKKPAPV